MSFFSKKPTYRTLLLKKSLKYQDSFPGFCMLLWLNTPDTRSCRKRSMSCNNFFIRNSGKFFQTVNVLSVKPQQPALDIEQADKEMSDRGMVVDTGEELLGPSVERGRIRPEIFDVKDGFRIWQLESFQVVVNSGSWRSEIRDSARNAQSGSGHDDNFLGAVRNCFGDFLDFCANESKLWN